MSSVPFVKILHPMATALLETVIEQVKEALPQITHALTIAGEQEEKQTSQNDREENLLTINGGVEEVFELFHEQGWTDGFPIIPPTETNVRAMLSQSVYASDTILGLLPPAMNPVTVDKLAVNAVMAGCVPEYFPVILAAAEELLDEDLALYSMQTATNATAPLIIVNGPIIKTLCLNFVAVSHRPVGHGCANDRNASSLPNDSAMSFST